MNSTSCVEFAEIVINSASLHIIDIETGRLLKKFIFTDGIVADAFAALQEYYDRMDAGDTGRWDIAISGGGFEDDPVYKGRIPNWNWGTDKEIIETGWFCREDRDNIQILRKVLGDCGD